jgi:hypothetical protein
MDNAFYILIGMGVKLNRNLTLNTSRIRSNRRVNVADQVKMEAPSILSDSET